MNVTIIPVGMLGTNCYLLDSGQGNCVVVDPGAQPGKIADVIAEKKLNLGLILLTHGHHDHIGGVNKLRERYPDAEVRIGGDDIELLTDTSKSHALARGLSGKDYLILGALPLADGEEIQLDDLVIKVVTTPGHTKGGVCYLVGEVMFSGDTLFLNDIGRCDLYGGDYGVMKQSLKKLEALPGNYTVYPGHGEATNLEHERKNNPYINE